MDELDQAKTDQKAISLEGLVTRVVQYKSDEKKMFRYSRLIVYVNSILIVFMFEQSVEAILSYFDCYSTLN